MDRDFRAHRGTVEVKNCIQSIAPISEANLTESNAVLLQLLALVD